MTSARRYTDILRIAWTACLLFIVYCFLLPRVLCTIDTNSAISIDYQWRNSSL